MKITENYAVGSLDKTLKIGLMQLKYFKQNFQLNMKTNSKRYQFLPPR